MIRTLLVICRNESYLLQLFYWLPVTWPAERLVTQSSTCVFPTLRPPPLCCRQRQRSDSRRKTPWPVVRFKSHHVRVAEQFSENEFARHRRSPPVLPGVGSSSHVLWPRGAGGKVHHRGGSWRHAGHRWVLERERSSWESFTVSTQLTS